jgi:glucosylceramidase
VNKDNKTFRYTPEYYVLKHASHYVLPGAKLLDLSGSYTDAMAFVNTDGSVVALVGNQTDYNQPVTLQLNGKDLTVTLSPSALNTVVLK